MKTVKNEALAQCHQTTIKPIDGKSDNFAMLNESNEQIQIILHFLGSLFKFKLPYKQFQLNKFYSIHIPYIAKAYKSRRKCAYYVQLCILLICNADKMNMCQMYETFIIFWLPFFVCVASYVHFRGKIVTNYNKKRIETQNYLSIDLIFEQKIIY